MTHAIFERRPDGTIVPRPNAQVRIFLKEKAIWRTVRRRKQCIGREPVYEHCLLLEFHPDWDYRLKFRGSVFVRPTKKILEQYAGKPGIAYDEEWIELRETYLHPEDRENLYIHCARKLNGGPLILHQARPSLDIEVQ